jgi:HEAT repeat protein
VLEAVPLASFALLGANVLIAIVLAARRINLGRSERRRAEMEARLRPLALALVHGEAPQVPPLGERDAVAFARLLTRYARQLHGEVREQVADFFESRGHLAAELAALDDRRGWRRATAAYALGDMGSDSACPRLVAALADPEQDVRSAAARSLGRLGSIDAVESLARALASEALPRSVGGQALLAIGPGALPGLDKLLSHPDAATRAVATELIGLLGGGSEIAALRGRLRDTSSEVRAKAARALGRLGAADAVADLRPALDDRVPFVRAAAAGALGALGDEGAFEALVEKATGDEYVPAHAAAQALARIDRTALLAVAKAPDSAPHLREAADLTRLSEMSDWSDR